ncbi:MAG TPA: hydroxymyristoyl-ACP dehydratase [Burkholderiaceae bacterium]|nr:hydroxymyristoyl-ACP dehydratase [Burkholderiaceae bacterium]
MEPRTLTRAGIAALIPHQGPMCLLARLDAWSEQHIVCAATNHRDLAHPLRTRRGLLATAAIEYAAQAMALHGALVGRTHGTPPAPGVLASARGVQLNVLRLDDLRLPERAPDELRIEATRQAGDARQILYGFTVHHGERLLAAGRAAVVLNAALAA